MILHIDLVPRECANEGEVHAGNSHGLDRQPRADHGKIFIECYSFLILCQFQKMRNEDITNVECRFTRSLAEAEKRIVILICYFEKLLMDTAHVRGCAKSHFRDFRANADVADLVQLLRDGKFLYERVRV